MQRRFWTLYFAAWIRNRDNCSLALSQLGFEIGTIECLGSISRQWRSSFILYTQSYLSNIIIYVNKDHSYCSSSESICLDISILVLLWKQIIRLQSLQECSMITAMMWGRGKGPPQTMKENL